MVLLSRVLAYRVNRPLNIIAAAATILTMIANRPGDLDDLFFYRDRNCGDHGHRLVCVELAAIGGLGWGDPACEHRQPAICR